MTETQELIQLIDELLILEVKNEEKGGAGSGCHGENCGRPRGSGRAGSGHTATEKAKVHPPLLYYH